MTEAFVSVPKTGTLEIQNMRVFGTEGNASVIGKVPLAVA
jgi:hypothetical protein